MVSLFSSDIKSSLAGLAYNVEASLGMQLLLEEPIYQSLTTGNSENLLGLFASHHEGFWTVLEHVVLRRLDTADPIHKAISCTCLENAKILAVPDTSEKRSILGKAC
jgi:hypothetical protein